MSAAFQRDLRATSWPDVRTTLDSLDVACSRLMCAENVPPERTLIRYFADVCYVGQSHHLEIPLNAAGNDPLGPLYRDFLAAHDRIYGYSTAAPARIVNLRVVHFSPVDRLQFGLAERVESGSARKLDRRILTPDGPVVAAVYDRASLVPGAEIAGPAIVEQVDTTVLIEAGWRGMVAPSGTLLPTTG
jgi:N-methylhydantoinase A